MDKKALRKAAAALRAKAHGSVDASVAIAHLRNFVASTEGRVSFYWPIRTEIDPRPLLEELAGVRDVCLPVTVGYAPLVFRPWAPGVAMIADSFGVEVPADTTEVIPQVLVVPMLAFDERGHRLGYGAGHYDRAIARILEKGIHPRLIGMAFDCQQIERVPVEPHDQPLDAMLTETGYHPAQQAAA